jgi:hypothetical protein
VRWLLPLGVLLSLLLVPPKSQAASGSARQAICYVFGPYCQQALRVAYCESRYSIWAQNGQYVNIFQMGYSERRRYGWHDAGSPAWQAALAAWRYFVASGYSWRAWACKP